MLLCFPLGVDCNLVVVWIVRQLVAFGQTRGPGCGISACTCFDEMESLALLFVPAQRGGLQAKFDPSSK